jgi:membrane protein implicated in regulation of membrane protease activity
MALVWIVIALLLIGVELHHLAFFAMFGSAGAVAAGVVAAVAPSAIPLQIGVGAAVAGAGLVLVRPHMSHAFARRGPGVVIGGVHGGLVGARGVTIDQVGLDPNGHVKLLGEKWLAVSLDDEPIAPATPVIVTKVVGTTLTVRAAAEQWELS